MSLEGSTPLSHNSIDNNEKAAVAISDVNDIIRLARQLIKVNRRPALDKKRDWKLSTSYNDTQARSQSLNL